MSSAPKEVSPQVGKFTTILTSPRRPKLVAEGDPPTRRRKWGPSLSAVIIVLFLLSGGALMLMGFPIEIQGAYRSAVVEMQRLTVRENAKPEAASREAAQEKALAEEAESKAVEEKLAAVAAARQEDARQAADEKARAEAADEMAEAQARAAAQEVVKRQAAQDASLKAEEAARKATDGKPKSDAEVREQAKRAEADLNLSEQDRKKVQMSLTALGFNTNGTDGAFGPRTRAMITAWQKKQGLPETGFLDESQLVALLEQATLAKRADETELDARQRAERAEAGLQLSEQDRKRVQVALNSLGHEIPPVTGYFGPRTRAMIKAWQKTQGLPVTGYLTEAQLATLRQQAAAALAQRKVKEDPHGTK
jgi:peptidoglycan hydrolase-like protein with peptidoglycan-binding domain